MCPSRRIVSFCDLDLAVKLPRFRIVWLMVVVAIVAVDFGAGRAIMELERPTGVLLTFGALPMASMLAGALLAARQHSANRLFLVGFATFGAIALGLHFLLVTLSGGDIVEFYVLPWLRTLDDTTRSAPPLAATAIRACTVAFLLGLPQFAFAVLGGFLSCRFRVTITRR